MRITLSSLALVAVGAAAPFWAQPAADDSGSGLSLRVDADYLALHVSGQAPSGASAVEYRLTLSGAPAQPGPWTGISPMAADGSFKFDVPLPNWRWAGLEARAMAGDQVLATTEAKPKLRAFTMLTPERIADLPEGKRASWQSYMEISLRHAEHEQDVLAAECRQLGLPRSKAAPDSGADFEMDGEVLPSWYGSAGALKTADALLSYQTPTGGWSKAVDYAAGPRAPGMQWTINPENVWHYCGTLDNRSTSEQIKFLANVHQAARREDAKAGALRGVEWLLIAQFPNGGWPQVYPVESGYHEAITLNDSAMLHALEVLLSVSLGEAPFAFVDQTVRQRAATAFEKGIACLVDCQVKIEGRPAVWCAQHDPLSLEPVAARLKEPPSLSGAESADLLKFLMRKGPVTAATRNAIQDGIEWLASHRITNLRKTRSPQGRTDYAVDANSDEVYWARFYDVKTCLPIFAGAQDGVIYHTFHEMAQHNKVAYDYFTTKPADVVGKEFERWKKRMQKETK